MNFVGQYLRKKRISKGGKGSHETTHKALSIVRKAKGARMVAQRSAQITMENISPPMSPEAYAACAMR